VKATDTYEQNANTKQQRYESENKLANLGDKIRGYIQQIAGSNSENAANTQTKDKLAAMEAQISKLAETMTVLAAAVNKENHNPNKTKGNTNTSGNGDQKQKRLPNRNMGGYCHSCGFHLIGAGHNSSTCNNKKADHKSEATWNNRMDGSTLWPKEEDVLYKQRKHAEYRDRKSPTN
jgi:hypothetical protein